MVDQGLLQRLQGASLTTAEILYRMPDYPTLLQTYIWQDYDEHPRFPKLHRFLDFWNDNLDGQLFRITVAHNRLVKPSEVRLLDGEFRLH